MEFAQLYGQFDLTPEGSIILMAVSLGIFLIFLVIFGIRISQSIKDSALNNGKINQYLAAVPADRIGTVSAIYENTRKHLSGAIILCIIGGVFGFQRIYLGKRKSAMAMLIFFWTGVPTVISLFDIVNMPRIVSEFNLGVIESLYNQLAAPEIDNH